MKLYGFILAAFACALLIMPSAPAYAESLTLKRPLNSNVNSRFGWREASRTGGQVKVDRLHAGTDYRARTPTPVPYEGSWQSCGGGNGVVQNACNVKQIFRHLSNCSKGNFVTGSVKTTQPHLHHELYIGGTPVDGEHYFQGSCGTDLCTEQVRKCLLDHAKTKGGKGGSASDAASSNAPQPGESTTTSSSTYVGTGEVDPVTGDVNRGSPYYLDSVDGRITRDPILDDTENVMPILPETTTNLTQSVSTNNEITGCATDTWKAMVNQSVLQARREMIINQALIAKADSVMAYSCMNDGMKKVSENLGPVFSETKRWVNAQIDILGKTVTVNKELGESSLDGAIFAAATNAYMNYAQKAFKHSMMGGMLDTGNSGDSGSNNEDPSSEDAGAQDALPCGVMNQVWQMAKCRNYSDDPGFPKFEDLISGDKDPRKYPKNMTCKNTGITQGMIDIARQKEVKNSKLAFHYDQMLPDNGACGPVIATGITVHIRKGEGIISRTETYQDGLCISPGCSYQTSNFSGTGKCEVKKP